MTTAAITGIVGNGNAGVPLAVALAREIASPTAIVALDDKLELWLVGAADETKLADVGYESLTDVAGALRPRFGQQPSLQPNSRMPR